MKRNILIVVVGLMASFAAQPLAAGTKAHVGSPENNYLTLIFNAALY